METQVIDLIRSLMNDVWPEEEGPPPADLGPESPLLGPDGLLSSMALVSLLLALEQELEARHGASIRLVDERAMSHRRSPFRTVGTLAAYAVEQIRGAN